MEKKGKPAAAEPTRLAKPLPLEMWVATGFMRAIQEASKQRMTPKNTDEEAGSDGV